MIPDAIIGSYPMVAFGRAISNSCNNEDTTWDRLGPRMEEIFKERAEKIAFVKGDNDVLFMDVARAIDIMRGAGIDKIGLITAKLEAGQ
jgi:biopolymer transport protein TolR